MNKGIDEPGIRDQNKAIREWAIKNGFDIPKQGRIPKKILEAYHEQKK
jgi:hypothetical protein